VPVSYTVLETHSAVPCIASDVRSLHIERGFRVPGTASWRQGSRLDDKEIPGWYFAEKRIAERYAFLAVFVINGRVRMPVQTMLEVSTSQAFKCRNKAYKFAKDMRSLKLEAFLIRRCP
jgi:hypothetical protein